MHRQKNTGQKLALFMGVGLLLATLPILFSLRGSLEPLIDYLAQRAALLSAALGMPEGSITLLENRFSGDVYSSSSSVAPPPPPPASSEPEKKPEPVKSSSSSSRADKGPAPEVDAAHRGVISAEDFAGYPNSGFLDIGFGYLRNYTKLSTPEIVAELEKPLEMVPELDGSPQVLIIHTHATEAYEVYDAQYFDTRNTWRSTDDSENMVAVGDEIARVLEEEGIGVIHDPSQHDYPSYNGAYERSAETVKKYLEEYPTIKIVLDVHRDGIQRADDLIVKAVTEVDGEKAAQLMVITGCEDGTMNVPKWAENLRFAAAFTNAIAEDYPTLMRPIFFCYRKYNMDLTQGSILLEFGSHGNTLDEAIYTGNLVAHSLAKLLKELAGA